MKGERIGGFLGKNTLEFFRKHTWIFHLTEKQPEMRNFSFFFCRFQRNVVLLHAFSRSSGSTPFSAIRKLRKKANGMFNF